MSEQAMPAHVTGAAESGHGMQGNVELTDDGIELYYQTRGSGPDLLLVQGGVSEAGATDQLASALADQFLVVSYDRRGLSRSSAVPDGPVDMDRHALDAATVLQAATDGPAHVLGGSIGALIALHLAVRSPELLSTVVAHEPPMAMEIHDPVREEGLDSVAAQAEQDVRAAIGKMAALIGGSGEAEPGAQPSPAVGDVAANLRWFFRHDFPAVRTSTLTAQHIAAVADAVTVVPTGGRGSRQGWEYRCAAALNTALGNDRLVELPGGHDALVSHPQAVADQIRTILVGGR